MKQVLPSVPLGSGECIFSFPSFVYLLLSSATSLLSSMSCSERVRSVWACGVSPSNNRYRKRNGERRQQGERGAEKIDIEEGNDKEKQEPWWCWGGQQLAFDGEACLFNESISPPHTYPQITASRRTRKTYGTKEEMRRRRSRVGAEKRNTWRQIRTERVCARVSSSIILPLVTACVLRSERETEAVYKFHTTRLY